LEEPAFVVLAPGASKCADGELTLLPRAHVSVLTELGSEDMASVLAGLSKLVRNLKQAEKMKDIEVSAHPAVVASERHNHLHFHLIPRDVSAHQAPDSFLKRRRA